MADSYSGSSSCESESEDEQQPISATNVVLNKPTPTPQPLQQQQQQQPPVMMQTEREAPTQVPLHWAKFVAMIRFNGRQFYDGKGRLLENGAINLSVLDGTLTRVRCSHEEDFAECDMKLAEKAEKARMDAMALQQELQAQKLQAQQQTPTALGHHHGLKHKKKKKNRIPPEDYDAPTVKERYSDLTAQVDIKKFTSTWNRALYIEFPTMRKFQGEGYMGENVGYLFIPNTVSPTNPLSVNVCKRPLTEKNVQFRNLHYGVTLASLDDHVSFFNNKAYIQRNSPIIMVHNMPKYGNEKITGPTPNFAQTNQVEMDVEKAKKYLTLTKQEMTHHMNYSDVTKNFRVRISLPVPFHRQAAHQLFLSGQGGWQFEGFGDKEFQHRGQELDKISDDYKDTWYEMNMEYYVKFLPQGAK
jgi:hypothetical protein